MRGDYNRYGDKTEKYLNSQAKRSRFQHQLPGQNTRNGLRVWEIYLHSPLISSSPQKLISASTPGVEVSKIIFYTTIMATPLRQFQSDIPYHIFNRGNRKSNIFLNTKDYLRFIKRLKKYKNRFEIEILCYCLMPNHFHLILKSPTNDAITSFMLSLCTSYSKYFNIRHELVGRLFQERYRAKIVETDEYLLHLSRYIHLNPISEDIEKLTLSPRSTPGVELSRLKNYPWSSYNEYYNGIKGLCDKDQILGYFQKQNPTGSYISFVESGINTDEIAFISPFV